MIGNGLKNTFGYVWKSLFLVKQEDFPAKLQYLKIKSFLVASAITICNVITSLEEFCTSVSTVSWEYYQQITVIGKSELAVSIIVQLPEFSTITFEYLHVNSRTRDYRLV